MRFVHFKTIDSTLNEAKRQAETGDFHDQWISAEHQTEGRGRRGRDWVSESGNLFCTGLFNHSGDLASAARLSFVAALSAAQTLEQYIDHKLISIKWPNDILVDGKKIAGILLESGAKGDDIWIAVGIGINLVSHPKLESYSATHLLAHIEPSRLQTSEPIFTGAQPVLALLAQKFEYWHRLYMAEGFEPLRKQWLKRAIGMGGPVTARLETKTVTGIAIGMDMDGALEIRTNEGESIKIHAGDVFFSPRVL